MTRTMAEVLAEHQISLAWENGEERGITCLCGEDLPTEQERGEIDMTFLAAHQAAALSAAGFGLVADAGAKALEDAADGWSDWDALQAPEDWLRARAAAVRGEG